MRLTLFSYWRSSSAWRVRIGLGLKGLAWEYRAVNLAEGEQWGEAHGARNPMHQVPVLEVEDPPASPSRLAQRGRPACSSRLSQVNTSTQWMDATGCGWNGAHLRARCGNRERSEIWPSATRYNRQLLYGTVGLFVASMIPITWIMGKDILELAGVLH